MKQGFVAIALVAVVAFFLGYKLAPREILDEQAGYAGPMTVDTKQVLAATVESLRAESKLVSYTYRGMANVAISREQWVVFGGRQQLLVPADISYFVDLSQLRDSDVTLDEAKNEISVVLPRLMLTVAFDPYRATEINTGALTFDDDVVQELRKLNYETARKALVKQGQQAELVRLAKESTAKNVASFFRVPLRAIGKGDVQVNVRFAR